MTVRCAIAFQPTQTLPSQTCRHVRGDSEGGNRRRVHDGSVLQSSLAVLEISGTEVEVGESETFNMGDNEGIRAPKEMNDSEIGGTGGDEAALFG